MSHSAPLIVFADDDPDILQLYRMIVQRSPYDGLFVSAASEALTLCQTHTVALLVTDIHKPHISGIELFYSLRENPVTAHIPVLFVTASGADQALSVGVNAILRKPFTHQTLLETIQYLVNAAPA